MLSTVKVSKLSLKGLKVIDGLRMKTKGKAVLYFESVAENKEYQESGYSKGLLFHRLRLVTGEGFTSEQGSIGLVFNRLKPLVLEFMHGVQQARVPRLGMLIHRIYRLSVLLTRQQSQLLTLLLLPRLMIQLALNQPSWLPFDLCLKVAEMPYDDDQPKADRRTDGDWVSEEVDERPNAVDNDLDVDKPKETTLQNDERPSAIAIMPDCNGKNTSCILMAFPLQAATLPAKGKTFSHFKTTFADYESCEAYEQEPEYSPELNEATLSRNC
ncbi:hypothetical protein M9H77_13304 [Catharanthus roseus]|uniref:Uncharacterized protein n=1 Tax=Catharanthus roseus TaxID=4058 RepID=A0ACC0BJU6_CATRO|nr:hypothetical protein M9H77_13304 [Catharanthus roseus]